MTQLRDHELARRENAQVLVRSSPLRVTWALLDLVTSDLHKLHARFTCSVEAVNNRTDRQMLEEVLLSGREVVDARDLREHFAPAMRSAASEVALKHPASEWVAEQYSSEMIEALAKSAERVAFACGLRSMAPYQLELSSPTLEQQRLEEIQRTRMRERTLGQVEHLKQATELLKHFQDLRRQTPDLTSGQLLSQIAPADRGAMLETLLMASAQSSDLYGLVLVAGQSLLRIEMDEDQPRTRTIELPTDLGPLRSVRGRSSMGEPLFAIGAQKGVIWSQSSGETICYVDPALNSPLGFNAAIQLLHSRTIIATHSEGGLVMWQAEKSSEPMRREQLGGRGARNLVELNERVAFSSGNQLAIAHVNGDVKLLEARSAADVIALVGIDDTRLVVVHADGLLSIFDYMREAFLDDRMYGARLSAAGGLPWINCCRVLLASESGAIDCVGIDDQLVTRYLSPFGGMRMLAGSPALVAGVSADRQRLVLWNSWDGRKPVAEVHVTRLTRHRIADVQFV